MAEQWLRQFKLTIQLQKGAPEALDLSQFKIYFRIGQATRDTPQAAEIYIYNLSDDTMNKLAGNDSENKDTIITLEFGYKGSPLEIIFKGQVFQFRRGRDNPTDKWLCVLAQAGEHLKNYGVINQSIPAGTTIDDAGKALNKEMEKYDVVTGEVPQLSDQQYPRGRVFFGSLYNHMEQFYTENDIVFDISDGMFTANTIFGHLNKAEITLNRDTGMVGMPQLTTEGLEVTCLLNPKLKRGVRINVDMKNMQTESYDIAYEQQGKDQDFKNPNKATNLDGVFIIQAVEMVGDTRGTECYSNLVCTALNATVPKSGVSIKAVD